MNADAQIGAVDIGNDPTADTDVFFKTNIVAGMTAGEDGVFGTGDEEVISSSSNSPGILSNIGSLVINGLIGGGSQDRSTGIHAQQIVAVTVQNNPVPLLAGPGNDFVSGIGFSNLSVIEAGATSP